MRNSEFGMRHQPDLKRRTKAFALRILKLVDALPKTTAGRAPAPQTVRSRTPVAANHTAALPARATAHLHPNKGNLLEAKGESLFTLEVLCGSQPGFAP